MDGWVWSDGGMRLSGGTEVLGEKHYTAWVVDGWMGMEQWWNGTDLFYAISLNTCSEVNCSIFMYTYSYYNYSGTQLIRINWDGEPSGYAENLDYWIFL
jgi:hypothetical protein